MNPWILPIGLANASDGGAHEGATHGGDHAVDIPWHSLVIGTINLSLFLVILYAVARKPIAAAISGRAMAIRSGLDEAARVQAEAKARFDAVEVRLAALDAEMEEMRVDAREDAARESATLKDRGEAEALRIREAAARAIREESARARAEIRGEAVQIAVALARETLARNLSQADQERLAREFLAAVDADKPARTGVSE